MLGQIKQLIPKQIKDVLRPIKRTLVDNPRKRRLAKRMQAKHQELLQKIKGKEKIKVVFLAIHKSVWKVDPVLKKMLADPFFEPLILICPYVMYGEDRMWQDMQEAQEYFESKGYPVLSSYNKQESRWIKLEEINPDIVFFTNPHNLTRKEYYQDAYLNYSTCYVPYFSDLASNYDLNNVYNQEFHNVCWLIFTESFYTKKRFSDNAANKGNNAYVSGSPTLEDLLANSLAKKDVWKNQKTEKVKIIYAPHQSIFKDEVPNLSTFLEAGEDIKSLAIKYKDVAQWAFKPHTLLKSKLYKHPEWGVEKTNAYYEFWNSNDFTQLELGEYKHLFQESDAIIHDCGSFILEYLPMRKPCAYLIYNRKAQLDSINDFGMEALESYEILTNKLEIEQFVSRCVEDKFTIRKNHLDFLKKHIDPFYNNSTPSAYILDFIKSELK